MKILVIDDDALVGKTLARLLRAHEVRLISVAKEALEPIFSGDFDIIFCDVVMPGLSGLELFEIVNQRNPKLGAHFVFVTGGPSLSTTGVSSDASTRPVLHKPFYRHSLQTLLDSVVAHSS